MDEEIPLAPLLSFCWRAQGLTKSTFPLYHLMVTSTRPMALNTIFKLTAITWIPLPQSLPMLQTYMFTSPLAWKKSQTEHVQNQTPKVWVPIKSFQVYLILTYANSILGDTTRRRSPISTLILTSHIQFTGKLWQVFFTICPGSDCSLHFHCYHPGPSQHCDSSGLLK